MQRRSPLLTQFESALVIYFLGDLSAQTVGSNGFEDASYEPIRGLRALIIAGIICIPSYKWFLWLGNNFNYKSHWFSIGVKILVNQTFFTPIFNTYFFGMQSLLSGCNWEETKKRVYDTVPVSFVNSWKLWPAVTAFSFTYLKPQNRPIFAGCIAVVWQTYLSWLNKRAELKERTVDTKKGGAEGVKKLQGAKV
jgi:protein Mpv17